LGGRHKWGCFGPHYPALGAKPISQFLRSSFFLQTRLSFESLVPEIGFLPYLEPKFWIKNQKLVNARVRRKAAPDIDGYNLLSE